MKIIVRANNPREEFNYLKGILNRLDFFKTNHYKFVLPEILEFNSPISSASENTLFDLFCAKEYSESFFEEGLLRLSSKLDYINNALSMLFTLQNFWEFKTFDTYNICLTKYGPGGSYNSNTGKVVMLTDINGNFKESSPENTVIHEIVHIGIETSLVKKYMLTHNEKESLVDLIVQHYLGSEISTYKVQKLDHINLNTFITSSAHIKNLPNILAEYKKF